MNLKSVLTFFAVSVCAFDITAADLYPATAHKSYPNQVIAEAHYVIKTGDTLSSNSALKIQAETLVDQIFRQFQVLYPRFMSNKERPNLIVTTKDSPWDSQAYMPNSQGERMGILSLSEGLFDSTKADQETRVGIVAHELAHVLFWHTGVETEVLKPMEIAGRELTPAESIAVKRWFTLAQLAGGLTAPELSGLPFGSGIFQRDLTDLGSYLKLRGTDTCGQPTQALFGEIASKIMSNFSTYKFDLNFMSMKNRVEAKSLTQNLIKKIQACFTTQAALKERILLNQNYHLNGRSVPAQTVFTELLGAKVASESATDIELLVRAGARAHEEMNQIFKQFNLANLRWYSGEDQADEAAAAILRAMNLDISKYAHSVSRAVQMSDEDALKCDADLNSNREPPYGDLSDPHHAPCWRAWNLRTFTHSNKTLEGLN